MFVQNGVQRIEVVVKRDRGGGGRGNKTHDPEEATDTEKEKLDKAQQHSRRVKRMILTNVTHAFSVAKQITGMGINYAVEGVGIKHGDQAFQDGVHRSIEMVTDTANLVTSTIQGGVYGAWGGPIGAVVGAVCGLASQTASIGFKYARRERDYGVKMFKENNTMQYKRARANINITIGRLR